MRTNLSAANILLLFLILGVTAVTAPAASAKGKITLGAHISADGSWGAPEEADVLDGFSKMVGAKPQIVMSYSNPKDPLLTENEINNLEARKLTPMVTWEPFESGWSGPGMPLKKIASGAYDSHFIDAADLAKDLPFKVMIRFGHEMNGDWYPWSGDPGGYVAAWRHIVSVFKQQGADNVEWVWSPNVDYGHWSFKEYFPGDNWVDHVALDGYNWGTSGVGNDKWETLYEVFAGSYERITKLSSKPVILAETASSEIGGDKAEWIRQGFLRTIPNRFPRVSAVIWFDYDKEQNWEVDSSPSALSAYRQVAASPIYGGDGLLEYSVPPKPRVKALKVTPRKAHLRVKRHGKSMPRIRGVYRLSRAARVKIIVRRANHGRQGVVARQTRGSKRKGNLSLSHLIGNDHLRAGRYRVTAKALHRGKSVSTRNGRFRVVKDKHRHR